MPNMLPTIIIARAKPMNINSSGDFLGAKAPLRLAHVRPSVNPKKFQIAITEDLLARDDQI